jgi:membrane carboxypeptidase/penicillin-binding protein
VPFNVPEGLSFMNIDADTGKISTPNCPKTLNEAFIAGTEPNQVCDLHR